MIARFSRVRLVAAGILALLPMHAFAQLRTIPEQAVVGRIRHLEAMVIELDGTKVVQLSPGAQIRDTFNRLVLPVTLTERTLVRYLVDGAGDVHRVWILSAEEAAKLPPPPFPK